VLPNLTRHAAARRVLLEPGRGTLGALASQLRAPSPLRRRGCAFTLKNCCLASEEDATVEAIGAEQEAWGVILGVMAAGADAEPAGDVREALAEAVLCLARAEAGRKALWAAGAPELLRKAYELEEHRGACEAMEGAAQLFMADGFEPADEEDLTADGDGENGVGAGSGGDAGGFVGGGFVGGGFVGGGARRPGVEIEELD
jgi:uncharacterized membrane protein YgcG